MSESETKNLAKKIDSLRDDILSEIKATNGRISALELDKARREGRESVLGAAGAGSKPESLDWKKLAMVLAQSLGYGLGAAYLIAKAFFG